MKVEKVSHPATRSSFSKTQIGCVSGECSRNHGNCSATVTVSSWAVAIRVAIAAL